jgi:hypothetical protein
MGQDPRRRRRDRQPGRRDGLNIAVFAPSGDLDFYWQDGSGTFHQELVSPASLN